jgi:ABC-type uncharacterized transport system permease subunit
VSVTSLLVQTVRATVPYLGAALGGVWCERSGIATIALEGALLSSALGTVAVAHATGSPAEGLVAGMIVGALTLLLHAFLVTRLAVDPIVSGVAVNLAAFGGTRFVLRALYASSSNSPAIASFRRESAAGVADSALVEALLDPLVWGTVLAVALSTFVLRRTSFGLRVRAVGENPSAARALGIDVTRVRLLACALGGAICALGGASLAFDQHGFDSGISAGRGFRALAAVILGGWRPLPVAAACVAFAALDALEIPLEASNALPHALVQCLPYLVTLLALATVVRSRAGAPPAALSSGSK